MIHRLVIRVHAEADITDAALWYESQRPGLGAEFLAEVEITIGKVLAHPQRFPCLRRKPEVRRALTARFPHRIFFVLRPDIVVVFRVLHGARDDQEWKRNIPEN